MLRELFEWLHDDTAQHQPRNHGNDQPCKREEEQCTIDRILAKRRYLPRCACNQRNQRGVKQIVEDTAAHDFVLRRIVKHRTPARAVQREPQICGNICGIFDQSPVEQDFRTLAQTQSPGIVHQLPHDHRPGDRSSAVTANDWPGADQHRPETGANESVGVPGRVAVRDQAIGRPRAPIQDAE